MDTTKVKEAELREQLEEFALHMKPGTTKGKHRTAVFDTVELTKLVSHLIDKYTRESLINTLEDLKRTDWVGNDDRGEYVEVNDLVVSDIDSHIAQLTEQKDGE